MESVKNKKTNEAVLLMTSCVKPTGITELVLKDADVRLKQYLEALDFYLKNTSFKIVFIDNSNYDISSFFEKEIISNRLECLFFDGDIYDKSKGKGFGEGLILKYAFDNSTLIQNADFIIKVTGRLIVKNINQLWNQSRNKNDKYVFADTNISMTYAVSYFFIASKSFYNCFLSEWQKIDDSKLIYFECILANTIQQWRKNKNYHKIFVYPICVTGISASTGKMYKKSTFARKIIIFVKYLLYELKKTVHL